MNELIEKLAEQAGMIVDKYGLARDAETGLEDGVDIYKFARLIVLECADLFEVEWGEEKLTGNDVGSIVKKHFGVKL